MIRGRIGGDFGDLDHSDLASSSKVLERRLQKVRKRVSRLQQAQGGGIVDESQDMSEKTIERVGFFGRCMECTSRSQRIRVEFIEDNSVAVMMSTNVNLDPELMARLTKQPGKNTDTK